MSIKALGVITLYIALVVTAVIIKNTYDKEKSIMFDKRIAFIIDADSLKMPRIYHYADCKLALSIPHDKRVIFIGLDEIIKASNYNEKINAIDLQPCSVCKPPIPAEWEPDYPDTEPYSIR